MILNENKLRNIIRNILKEVTGFHGSAYDFDKFDVGYMSKGFGGQMHGWGIYVSIDPSTSLWFMNNAKGKRDRRDKENSDKWFRKRYCQGVVEKVKTTLSNIQANDDIYYSRFKNYYEIFKNYYADALRRSPFDFDSEGFEEAPKLRYIENALKRMEEETSYNADFFWSRDKTLYKECQKIDNVLSELLNFVNQHISNADDYSNRLQDDNAYHYIVKVPDDNGSNYFYLTDWIDPEGMRVKLEKAAQRDNKCRYVYEKYLSNYESNLESGTKINGKDFYKFLRILLGEAKNASLFIYYFLGYLGIHYRSNDEGECYVMFNAKDIQILWKDCLVNDYRGYDSEGSLMNSRGARTDDDDDHHYVDSERIHSGMETNDPQVKPRISKLYKNSEDYFDRHSSSKRLS